MELALNNFRSNFYFNLCSLLSCVTVWQKLTAHRIDFTVHLSQMPSGLHRSLKVLSTMFKSPLFFWSLLPAGPTVHLESKSEKGMKIKVEKSHWSLTVNKDNIIVTLIYLSELIEFTSHRDILSSIKCYNLQKHNYCKNYLYWIS